MPPSARRSKQAHRQFDREKSEERIAKLGGAIGRIKVGAATETELKDKKLRYEDALNSVKSAMNDSIVPGGGSRLVWLLRKEAEVKAVMDGEDEKLAVDILFRAMTWPIVQIAFNAGSEGSIVLEKCKEQEFGFGWNAATDTYGDLLDMGVIDPATVTMQAILNSCSIAASVLTTSALITEVPEDDNFDPMPDDGIGGIGGMPACDEERGARCRRRRRPFGLLHREGAAPRE